MSTVGQVIKCKAAVVWKPNDPVTVEEVEVEPPKKDEVRVKVVANGICGSDDHVIKNEMSSGFKIKFPLILGHEASGIVESVGENVENVAPGDTVCIVFMAQCYDCNLCKTKGTNFCLNVPCDQITMTDGTSRFKCRGETIYYFVGVSSLSEYTVVSKHKVLKVPKESDLKKTCLFGCGLPTGFGSSVNTAEVTPNSVVAIWGLGGVGLSAGLGARYKKASKIIGIDVNSSKFEKAKKFGFTDFVDCSDLKDETVPERLRKMTNGLGVDKAIVCVGSPKALEDAYNSLTKILATVCVIGLIKEGSKISVDPMRMIGGNIFTGSVYGGYKSKDCVGEFVEFQKENPDILKLDDLITKYGKLDDINELFNEFRSGRQIRIVVVLNEP